MRNREDQPRDAGPIVNDLHESPTILNLIERLERDLKESEGKASSAH